MPLFFFTSGGTTLGGTVAGASGLSGSLSVSRSLTGTINGQSTLSASLLSQTVKLSGIIEAHSSVGVRDGGNLSTLLSFTGTIAGQSTIAATALTVQQRMFGLVAGQSSVTGKLTILKAGTCGSIGAAWVLGFDVTGAVFVPGKKKCAKPAHWGRRAP